MLSSFNAAVKNLLWWARRSVSVVAASARAPRDAAVQNCLELEGSARSVVQFEGILPEAAPCIAFAPVSRDEQVGIIVDDMYLDSYSEGVTVCPASSINEDPRI